MEQGRLASGSSLIRSTRGPCMNTVLLYITLAFFAVVVVSLLVLVAGSAQAKRSADAEIAERDRGRRDERLRPRDRQDR
jgi:heme exporter protein D